jgi:hypothetical protein
MEDLEASKELVKNAATTAAKAYYSIESYRSSLQPSKNYDPDKIIY